jgi:hypothetical protein
MQAKIKCTICHPTLFAKNGRRAIEPCDDHLRQAIKCARDVMKRGGVNEEHAVGAELASIQYDSEWYGTPGLAELFDRCEARASAAEAERFMYRGIPSPSNYWCFEPHELYGIDDQAYAMSLIGTDDNLLK